MKRIVDFHNPFLTDELMDYIKAHYALNWKNSYHGIGHWRRVEHNGLMVAESNDADKIVVSLFAYTHDSCRRNEMRDQDHGYRAKIFIEQELQPKFLHLPPHQLKLLTDACAFHTDGLTGGDVTLQTCWDADRLDLGRVGIKPVSRYLCTPYARQHDVIEAAFERSQYPFRSSED